MDVALWTLAIILSPYICIFIVVLTGLTCYAIFVDWVIPSLKTIFLDLKESWRRIK